MLDRLFRRALSFELATEPSVVSPGLHHYFRELDEGQVVRYHLRVENDGAGLLICNATAAARLSPTGVLIAHQLLKGEKDEGGLVAVLRRTFRGGTAQSWRADIARVDALLDELAEPGGRYPLVNLDDPHATVHRRMLCAPLSAVLEPGGVEARRGLMDRLWKAAVPQVILLAGADPSHLVELVEHAEDIGLIAGVRGTASVLGRDGLLEEMALAGLDHLGVLYAGAEWHDDLLGEGDFEAAEELLQAAQAAEVCPVAVVPLTVPTVAHFDVVARSAKQLGVSALMVFAIASREASPEEDAVLPQRALRQAAVTAEEIADRYDLDLIWTAPLEWSPEQPLKTQVRAGPRAAGDASIRVAANGDIRVPQGPPEVVGNLAEMSWSSIWAHPAFRAYREATEPPERCPVCPLLTVCNAGCPAEPATWSQREAS